MLDKCELEIARDARAFRLSDLHYQIATSPDREFRDIVHEMFRALHRGGRRPTPAELTRDAMYDPYIHARLIDWRVQQYKLLEIQPRN